MKSLIFVLLFLAQFMCTATLPDASKVPFDVKSGLKVTLQEKIESKMLYRMGALSYDKTFMFVAEHEFPSKSFAGAMFCQPVPWFAWNESKAIDHFIKIATTRFTKNGIMLIANPRIQMIKYRGIDCLTIIA